MPSVLICPNCDTRYETAAVIPPEGRKVRCSKCNTVWTAMRNGEKHAAPDASAARRTAATAPSMTPPPPNRSSAGAAPAGSVSAETPPVRRDPPSPPASPAHALNGAHTAEGDDEIEFRERDAFADEEQFAGEDEAPQRERARDWRSNGRDEAEDTDSGFSVHDDASSLAAADEDSLSRDDRFDPYTDSSFDLEGEPPPLSGHGPSRELATQQDREPPRVDVGGLEKDPRSRRSAGASPLVGWLLLLLLVGSLAALVILAPSSVVRMLPGATPVYQALGVEVNPLGLAFANITHNIVYEGGGGQLEISGDIRNLTDAPIETPTVVFSLRDAAGNEIQQYTADVFQEPLAAGVTAPFAARMPQPDGSVKSVEVTFAQQP